MTRTSHWRLAAAVFGTAVVMNFVWELAQSPLYARMPPFPARMWHCLVASLGDGFIVLLIWTTGWLTFRRPDWFRPPRWSAYAVMLTAGLALAVIVEWAGLGAGRWSYTPRMPRVSGVGLVPLLQMVFVPPLIFAVAQPLRAVRA